MNFECQAFEPEQDHLLCPEDAKKKLVKASKYCWLSVQNHRCAMPCSANIKMQSEKAERPQVTLPLSHTDLPCSPKMFCSVHGF